MLAFYKERFQVVNLKEKEITTNNLFIVTHYLPESKFTECSQLVGTECFWPILL